MGAGKRIRGRDGLRITHPLLRSTRHVQKSAAALLLAARVGERFEALVTGVNKTGTWVCLQEPAVEGRLEVGVDHLDVGDRVRVRLLRSDVKRGFLDFARA